jgi:predicted small lipoprotein YifL
MNWLGLRSVLVAALLLLAACGENDPVELGPIVTGIVTDAATHLPIADVTVTVGGRRAVTNQTGAFFIAEANRGLQVVTAVKDGYARYTAEVTVGNGDVTDVRIAMVKQ